eukprot:114510_1
MDEGGNGGTAFAGARVTGDDQGPVAAASGPLGDNAVEGQGGALGGGDDEGGEEDLHEGLKKDGRFSDCREAKVEHLLYRAAGLVGIPFLHDEDVIVRSEEEQHGLWQ